MALIRRAAKEPFMQPYHCHAVIALVLLAGTGAASAQMPLTRNAVDMTAIEALQQVRSQRTMSTRSAPRVSKLPGLRKFPSQITVRRGLTNSLR
jgi:hypothetical protein